MKFYIETEEENMCAVAVQQVGDAVFVYLDGTAVLEFKSTGYVHLLDLDFATEKSLLKSGIRTTDHLIGNSFYKTLAIRYPKGS